MSFTTMPFSGHPGPIPIANNYDTTQDDCKLFQREMAAATVT